MGRSGTPTMPRAARAARGRPLVTLSLSSEALARLETIATERGQNSGPQRTPAGGPVVAGNELQSPAPPPDVASVTSREATGHAIQRCEHCDRPSPDGTYIMGICCEECLYCCGSRCVHVRGRLVDLYEVVDAAKSLTRQVAYVLRKHGDDYEVMHEGMRQSAEWLEEAIRNLDAFSPAAVKDLPGDGDPYEGKR